METEKRAEEQKRTEALELLKSILEIPSVNGKDREQETAVYLAEYLKRKGMETRVQLIDEHHGNVIGVLKGKTESWLLFWESWLRADASRRKQLFLREPVMRSVAVWGQRKS